MVILQYSQDTATSTFALQWFYAFPVWIFLEYTINTLPPILIILRLLRDDQAKKKKKSIVPIFWHSLSKDPLFYYGLVVQVLNTIFYCIVRYLDNYSNILLDDLKWSAVANGVEPLVHVIHVFFNFALSSQLQGILMKRTGKSTSKSAATSGKKSANANAKKSLARNASAGVLQEVLQLPGSRQLLQLHLQQGDAVRKTSPIN